MEVIEAKRRRYGKKDCDFPDCDRRHLSRGYCKGHYRQHMAGEALKPLRPRRPKIDVTLRDDQGRKQCITCQAWLPEEGFASSPSTRDGLAPGCRPCRRWARMETTYGIPRDRYIQMLAAQDERCAICRTDDPGGVGRWHIDHDHACCPGGNSCGRCVRGLLCSACNTGIGLLGDDIARIKRAIDYLQGSK